jgi:hypothetical protein
VDSSEIFQRFRFEYRPTRPPLPEPATFRRSAWRPAATLGSSPSSSPLKGIVFGNPGHENQTVALNGSYGRVIRRRSPRPVAPFFAGKPLQPASYDKLINGTET